MPESGKRSMVDPGGALRPPGETVEATGDARFEGNEMRRRIRSDNGTPACP